MKQTPDLSIERTLQRPAMNNPQQLVAARTAIS